MNLDAYLSAPGAPSTVELAAEIGCNPDQIRQWRHAYGDRKPRPDTCALIEVATKGAVTCEDLRPDLRWSRIKDKTWVWHQAGRPVHEVAPITEAVR